MDRKSVATIKSPEFININSISPLIDKCEIKVLYVGQNRNRSFISKEVAMQMAETLPGSPIVGYYVDSKEDFFDHGDIVIIDGDGIKYKDATKPYGFVAPDAKIWFKEFDDTDEFGNTVTREYLMTEGYLWTGQYPECKPIMEEGRPHSMKLNDKTMKGYWSEDTKTGIDYYIVNDATFFNLCILGNAVEPCFEGSTVSKPQVSANFSKNPEFGVTLYSMIQELKEVLNKGGNEMPTENQNLENSVVENQEATPIEEFSQQQDNSVQNDLNENQLPTEEFKKEEDDKKEESKEDDKDSSENKSSDKDEESKEDDKKEDDDKEEQKKRFALLEESYNQLQAQYSALEEEVAGLRTFKANVELEQKKELISKNFYMLSDEDTQNIRDHIADYSLDDIEKELSVICVRKKVNFTELENNDAEAAHEAAPAMFNLDSHETSDLPVWLQAVMATKNRNN